MEMIHWSDWKGGEGQKTKKVSANNNQPDDQHGGEVGLHDGDASDATARKRHTWRATTDAAFRVRRDASHGLDRANAVVRCTTINARRDDADVPTSAAVETGRSEVFLGDPGRA